jgi:hypothetical protein
MLDIKKVSKVCGTKFLEFNTASYDLDGKDATWDYCSRPKKPGSELKPDVVTMACKTSRGKYAVVKQPRVPMGGKAVYSFPAGLVEGNTVKGTAFKELEEETGYGVEKVFAPSSKLTKSPGLTDETEALVECKLGKKGMPRPEKTEKITVMLMSPKEVIALGNRLSKNASQDEYISSGLWYYMKGRSSRRF